MMESLEIDPNTDRDMFSENVSEVFTKSFQLKNQAAMGMDNTYILEICPNSDQSLLAASLSSNGIAVYDSESLIRKHFLPKSHEGQISGLKFSHENPNVLFSCSVDQSIKLWDLRLSMDNNQHCKMFKDSSRESNPKLSKVKPFTAFDISCDDRYICAGTEKVLDAFLLFWDARGDDTALLGGYWDSHEDDITTVKFHPEDPNRLASSGTDGIVNVFDISQSCEDDALETCHNTESSVQKLMWFHNNDKLDSLAILTHTEELALWNIDDLEPFKMFSREDLCIGLKRKLTEVCYFVDVHDIKQEDDSYELVIVGGSSAPSMPCLRLLTMKKNRLKPYGHLNGYKSALTRSSVLNLEKGLIFTGGEDGLLSSWSISTTLDGDKQNDKAVIKGHKKTKERSKPY